MKALLYKSGGRDNAEICQVPVPVCKDTQVLIRVMACGICKPADSSHDNGTSMLGEYPVIPGHEFAGIVEAVGKKVTRFKPGDRVAVDNGAPCMTCYYCQRGQFAFCENYKALGPVSYTHLDVYKRQYKFYIIKRDISILLLKLGFFE